MASWFGVQDSPQTWHAASTPTLCWPCLAAIVFTSRFSTFKTERDTRHTQHTTHAGGCLLAVGARRARGSNKFSSVHARRAHRNHRNHRRRAEEHAAGSASRKAPPPRALQNILQSEGSQQRGERAVVPPTRAPTRECFSLGQTAAGRTRMSQAPPLRTCDFRPAHHLTPAPIPSTRRFAPS